jgi:simple sugar transport system ATP-binding protein
MEAEVVPGDLERKEKALSDADSRPVVSAVGICKRFSNVVANDEVDFEIYSGEVHALLGENGSGKSTLCKILTGLYRPDAGTLFVDGRPVAFRSPRAAYEAGIFLVQQNFSLVGRLTVAENIVLGLDRRGWWVGQAKLNKEIRAVAQQHELEVEPERYIWQLSVGERQRVEILKALYRGARVLILDEPTTVLTPQECEQLFSSLRQLASAGAAIIFISHKLREVVSVADQVTVLRQGVVVASRVDARDGRLSAERLAQLMLGGEVVPRTSDDEIRSSSGVAVLVVDGVTSLNEYGREVIRAISLTVRSGEILGVVGVAGNGQRELAEVITGLRARRSGSVRIGERELANGNPADAIAAGTAYVPEDRFGIGLVPDLPISDNLVLKVHSSAKFSRLGLLRSDVVASWTEQCIKDFAIKGAPDSLARQLSGGNAQRVLLARELSSVPRVLVAAAPTRGLDVAATESVRRLLIQARSTGVAVLLISEDLDEVLELADRVAVMFRGGIVGTVERADAERNRIGVMMAGVTDGEDSVAL